ncbi:hypothetical protein [Fusobacterium animalis]|uniref:hypothetical protein n=1 Tax=Fusobacterium animalis TaxID=76859 RepID=UPI0030CAFEDD
MSVIGALKFNIDTFLNSQGFQQFKANLKQSMSLSQRFKEVTGSTLGKLAIGYFSISGLVSQYNKAVEASNYQIEQEAKLYNTLRAQNFRDEQIKSIIDMTGELQKLGVVGDEVTIAGAQRLATFRMQESSIKKLLPVMQDMLVKEKGLNGTGQDMEGIASIFAKAMNGQTMVLKRNGIVLSEREEQLLKVGTEEQKVALLAEAVRRSVGEQNKEFLKTPEGKIINAKNRIGDLYETWGMSIRDTRAKFWEFMAENADGIQDLVTKVFKAGGSFVDTFIGVFRDIKRGFNALPDGAKTGLKVVGGLALATKFPLVALALAVEDVFAAFQGKESFTEDAINALLKFTGTDYRFADLRKGVSDFWKLWTEGADSGIEKITLTTKVLTDLLDVLKGGAGFLQMTFGISGGLVRDIEGNVLRLFKGEEFKWDNSWGNIKGGWSKIRGSWQHMDETSAMHDSYLLEEAEKKIKQQSEAAEYRRLNQRKTGVPVEKDFAIPGSQLLGISTSVPNFTSNNTYNSTMNEYKKDTYNSTVNEYKKNNEAIKVELPTNINEAINNLNEAKKTKSLDSKVIDDNKKVVKPDITIINNQKYNPSFVINEATDGEKIKNMFDTQMRNYKEQEEQKIRAQIGMNYGI